MQSYLFCSVYDMNFFLQRVSAPIGLGGVAITLVASFHLHPSHCKENVHASVTMKFTKEITLSTYLNVLGTCQNTENYIFQTIEFQVSRQDGGMS